MNSVADGTTILFGHLKHQVSVAHLFSGRPPFSRALNSLLFLLPGFDDDFCGTHFPWSMRPLFSIVPFTFYSARSSARRWGAGEARYQELLRSRDLLSAWKAL
jgi:hypothetical protein